MPDRLFVATLGFNETYIVSTLHKYGASKGDGLLIVTLAPIVGGVKKALDNLAGIAGVMGFTHHGVVEVDRGDIPGSIGRITMRIKEAIESGGYSSIVADLSGGPRIVVVSTLIALLITPEASVEVRVQDETGGEGELRFGVDMLRTALTGLGEKGRILAYITGNPGASPAEIAGALGLSPKTVSNYVSQLKRMGLAAQRGRGRGVYPTEWDQLLALLGGVGGYG